MGQYPLPGRTAEGEKPSQLQTSKIIYPIAWGLAIHGTGRPFPIQMSTLQDQHNTSSISKILPAIITIIRLWGIKIFHYLDDVLVVAHASEEWTAQREVVRKILSEFGCIVNKQKNQLIPTQEIEYLGLVFYTSK